MNLSGFEKSIFSKLLGSFGNAPGWIESKPRLTTERREGYGIREPPSCLMSILSVFFGASDFLFIEFFYLILIRL